MAGGGEGAAPAGGGKGSARRSTPACAAGRISAGVTSRSWACWTRRAAWGAGWTSRTKVNTGPAALKDFDVAGGEEGVQSPIFAHPRFEHLEAEGAAQGRAAALRKALS